MSQKNCSLFVYWYSRYSNTVSIFPWVNESIGWKGNFFFFYAGGSHLPTPFSLCELLSSHGSLTLLKFFITLYDTDLQHVVNLMRVYFCVSLDFGFRACWLDA